MEEVMAEQEEELRAAVAEAMTRPETKEEREMYDDSSKNKTFEDRIAFYEKYIEGRMEFALWAEEMQAVGSATKGKFME